MKKSTNKYRRCPNCPHHARDQPRCCCQKGSISSVKSRAITSRPKKQPSTIDNSSIMINNTIPTIIAQFSALRTQNNHLKRQLLNVSTFLKDDPNISISTHHQNEPTLSQKLFLSNKNLKEAMIEIDNLSKMNKQLYQRNTQLTQQYQGMKIQIKQMQAYCSKYKKKCKEYSQTIDSISNREEIEGIKKQNYYLQQDNLRLRDQLRMFRYQNNSFYRPESPQWVAHTSNKVYKPEHIIVKQQSGPLDINFQTYKRKISETINTLKSQSTTFSTNSIYDHLNSHESFSIEKLIQMLLETYTEAIYGYFNMLIKELNRKLNNYQKKLNNLISKIENFLLIFKNKKLKKKIFPNINQNISFLKTQRIPMMDITNYYQ